jgi:predicted small secreted protein
MKGMKKAAALTAFLPALVLLLAGCTVFGGGKDDDDDDDDGGNRYEEKYWGEWIRMDTGQSWYISGGGITIDGGDSNLTGAAELEKESEHVLKVKDGGKTYSLYASRRPNGSFRISVEGIPGAAASIGRSRGLGSMELIVENIKNAAERHTVPLPAPSSGPEPLPDIVVPDITPGDTYRIVLPDGPEVQLPVNNDGDHLGNLELGASDAPNFKASIWPANTKVDMMRLYARQDGEAEGEPYALKVIIENTGTAAANWNTTYAIVSAETDLSVTGTFAGSLAGLSPGAKKEIPLTVKSTGPITEEKEKRALNVVVTDLTASERWNDPVELEFKREKRIFSMASSNTVQGVVITPNAKTYFFKTAYGSEDGKYHVEFDLPYSSSNYIIVFSGASASTEAYYSMAVGGAADTDFTGVSPKQGNNEDNIFPVGQGETIKNYLYKGALHYYSAALAE